ncbi:ABC transporter permease [Kaistia dalseonensis]|uniref:Ribose transport system permease protein n=1 Tax=Kaistia dalseonensis TaxID=410840 RepID=A0ABU0H3Y5_9HYPH|nr:ABC transporter permease [Kaistia dalseonensis]MCX5494437.1 ABC transporter permease [Kaistia dalseonensis]MDQ0437016.1 ribose transport system permease protein [Kaistia dalseonensis]
MSASQTERRQGGFKLTQENIVFFIALLLFIGFSVLLPGFFDTSNLLSLVQNVAILGILGIGMGIVVIGRGIDLAMVSTMALSTAWTVALINRGFGTAEAIGLGLAFAAAVGIIMGVLVAYVEIPAIFATLAMSTVIYGFGRLALVDLDVIYLPDNAIWLRSISNSFLGVPLPVIWFSVLAIVAYLFLRFTKWGRYFYAIGDNRAAARITGIPVRPMTVIQYLISSMIAFGAGLITASLLASVNIRVAQSTMVYDVILVVVLGGIGLSGGKGGVRNILVGTILIGILLNGMTILDMPFTMQNIVKGTVLLIAIIVDSLANPRDEQTAQQGDI